MARRPGGLIEEELTRSVIGAFFDVYNTLALPAFAARQLHNYLRATTLAIGLLLHFGPEPKFHRLISPRAQHS